MMHSSKLVRNVLLSVLLASGLTAGIAGCSDDSGPEVKCVAVVVGPGAVSLDVGKTILLSAKCVKSDATEQDVTSDATWSSSAESNATVAKGTVTGVAPGQATITAEYNSLKGTASVTVTKRELISFQLTPATATLLPNGTQQFTATANFNDGSTEDVSSTATWTTDNAAVATVAGGMVTGVAKGTATISAEYAFDGTTKNASAAVVVEDKLKSLAVTPASGSITVGTTQQFEATGTTESGTTINLTSQVSWTSSTPATATVSNLGLATGVAKGQTTITATFDTLSATATLDVTDPALTSVEISPAPSATLTLNGTQQFTATAIYANGTNQNVTSSATWTSGDGAIVSIDAAGLATGKGTGTTAITASFGGMTSAATNVTVDGVVSLSVTPATATVTVGATQQFLATATFASGSQQLVTAAWQSSDTAVASIDAAGLATGLTAGNSTIQASYGGVQGSSTLTVSAVCPTQAGFSIAPVAPYTAPVTVALGGAFKLTATSGSNDVTSLVTWNVTPATYVGAGAAAGDFLAIAAGTGTTITATYTPGGSCPALTSNAIAVTVSPADLVKATIDNPPAANVPVGSTYSFKCTFEYSDGTTVDATAMATWASSTAATASISNAAGQNGVATAVAAGTTNITCAGTNQAGVAVTSAAAPLTVNTATLVYISLAPAKADLNVGQSQQFTATGHYSDGANSDLTNTATWLAVDCASTPAPIANFTAVKGLVTAVTSTNGVCGSGNYGNLVAKYGAIQTIAKITVKTTAMSSIAVNCAAPLSCLPSGRGYRVSCTATASYADGTSGDITNTASWSTTDATVATASAGRVTIVGNGTAVVQAAQGGKTSPATGAGAANATVTGVALTLNGITVSGTSPINKGIMTQYTATGDFSGSCCSEGCNYDITESASWSSNNTATAAVGNTAGSKGSVTGVAAGNATISAALGTMTGNANLTVTNACLQKVEITGPASITVPGGVVVPVGVNGFFSDAPTTPVALKPGDGGWNTSCSGFAVHPTTWQMTVGTSNCAALTFSATGCGGDQKTDTFAANVDNAAVLSALTIEPGTASIRRGTYQDYVAYATYTGYTETYNVSDAVTWSSNPSACVGAGKVATLPAAIFPARRFQHATPLTDCTTTISAIYGPKTAQATLQVSSKDVTSVVISNVVPATCTEGSYPVGVNINFTATVTYSDGSSDTNPTGITFSSSDPSKLSLTGSRGTTVAPSGTTNPTVTASIGGKTSAAYDVVIATNTGANAVILDGMAFAPATPLTLNKNVSAPLKIYGLYANCTEPAAETFDLSTQVTTSSSNSTLVAVSTTSAGTTIQTFNTASPTPVTLSVILGAFTEQYQVVVGGGTCFQTVSISPATVTSLPKGLSQVFVATATDNAGTQTDVTGSGSWSTSDSSVLSRSGATFTAVKAGSATVGFSLTGSTVCAGGDITKDTISATAPVTTTAATIKSLVIASAKNGTTPLGPITLPISESQKVWATATMTDNSTQDVTATATWTSQQTATATVSGGIISGVAAGTTIIQVSAGGQNASLSTTVASCGSPTVTISTVSSGSLPLGQTRAFTASAAYGGSCNGSWDVTSKATWSSSAPAIASVTAGTATGVAAGNANISAVYNGGTSNTVSVNVVAVSLYALTVSSVPSTIYAGSGGAVTLTVSAEYRDTASNSYTLDPPVVSWAIADNTVVSISGPTAGTGNREWTLTGLKAGSSTFIAQHVTVVSSAQTANVSAACINAVAITSPSGNVIWPVGTAFKLATQCTRSDGTHPACSPTFSGSVGDISGRVAFASSGEGVVTGTTSLKASIAGCGGATVESKSINLTAGTATLSSIALPATHSMPRGVSRDLAATGTYANGTGAGTYDLSWLATYTSANNNIVSPAAQGSGKITSHTTAGSAVVTASYGNKTSNNCTVTVTPTSVLTSITISAEDNYISGGDVASADAHYPAGGYNLQLTATGHYSDGSSANITGDVVWTLDGTTTYGTIDAAGLFTTGTPTAAQIQTVRATQSGIVDTFTIEVLPGAATTIATKSVAGGAPATSINLGSSTNYAAHITIAGGATFWATRNVIWSSSAPTIGTIVASGSDAGKLTGVAQGITNISASRGSISAGALAVTVGPKVVTKTWCEPKTGVSLVVGGTAQLAAFVQYSDGSTQDVTGDTTNTTWASQAGVTFVNSASFPGLIAGSAATSGAYVTPAHLGVPAAGGDRCLIVVQ